MANLSVTLECNRDCAYCFTRSDELRHEFLGRQMNRSTYLFLLGFLQRSGIDQARLLGGEPTLLPDFRWSVDAALDRGFRVMVFSNGLMPRSVARFLASYPAQRVSVLVNLDTPGAGWGENELEACWNETLSILGDRVYPGLNIHHIAPNLDGLIPLIDRYGLQRTVRLGLAHPVLAGHNEYLNPKDYARIGARIADFAPQAAENDILLELDCGFVPCMFPVSFLDSGLIPAGVIGTRCGAVPDLLPDGSAIACYPLASLWRLPVTDDSEAGSLRESFAQATRACRTLGVFRDCADCRSRLQGTCCGGCLAAALRRLDHPCFSKPLLMPDKQSRPGRDLRCGEPAPGVTEPDCSATTGRGTWAIPYVDQPPEFWDEMAESYGPHIREVYFPLPGGVVGSGRPEQPGRHLPQFLRRVSLPRSVLVNSVTLPGSVEEIAPKIVETLRRLDGEYGLAGVTVANLLLALRIRENLPHLRLTASVLMDIERPSQALLVAGICDTLVPSGRIMRNLPALRRLREAFPGRMRLIVNESCLPGCPVRVQHFHEMADGCAHPKSLCTEMLARHPWMRLTGTWVLPQHLDQFAGLYDELKLAGRITLSDPARYRRVLGAYVGREPLGPHEIGGGPASVLEPIEITSEYYEQTLHCGLQCHRCKTCRDFYDQARRS